MSLSAPFVRGHVDLVGVTGNADSIQPVHILVGGFRFLNCGSRVHLLGPLYRFQAFGGELDKTSLAEPTKQWLSTHLEHQRFIESPLDCKEIKPVNPKGNQLWIFTGRTDAEAEAPILWPRDAKSWLIGKDHDAGKDWGQEEKGATEDEMVGWHRWVSGHEFEQTLEDSEGQGSWCVVIHGVAKSDWTTVVSNTKIRGRWLQGFAEWIAQDSRFLVCFFCDALIFLPKVAESATTQTWSPYVTADKGKKKGVRHLPEHFGIKASPRQPQQTSCISATSVLSSWMESWVQS